MKQEHKHIVELSHSNLLLLSMSILICYPLKSYIDLLAKSIEDDDH